MSGDNCQRVHDFFDGLLDEEADGHFRAHLAICADCQRELHDIMQMAMAMDQLQQRRLERAGGEVVAIAGPGSPPRPRPRQILLAVSVAACAAGVAFVPWVPQHGSGTDPLATFVAKSSGRSIQARLSSHAADEYRPYNPLLGGTLNGDEALPMQALAELERRKDWAGMAAVYLLADQPKLAASALTHAPSTPEFDNDRAVMALTRRDLASIETALNLLDGVLARNPGYTRALWNRGLVLRELGLTYAAGAAFQQVAKAGERGWSEEAGTIASAVVEADRRRERSWNDAVKAGEELVATGALPSPELVEGHPGVLRQYLYHALRAAPSKERVLALLSMAAQLDRQAGGDVLQRAVRRTAALDFARRRPWVDEYRRFYQERQTISDAKRDLLIERLRRAGQPDLLLGVLTNEPPPPGRAAEIGKLVVRDERDDPWFVTIAAHELAREELARDHLLEAEQRLLGALPACHAAHLTLRCGKFEHELAMLYKKLNRPLEARRVALEGLQHALRDGEWGQQTVFIEDLAVAARYRRAFGLSHAYLDEIGLRKSPRCVVDQFQYQMRARLYLEALDGVSARRELAAVVPCEEKPVPLAAGELYADLARLGASPEERAVGKRILDALRAGAALSPSEVARADVAEGRLFLDVDAAAARPLLEHAIARAEAVPVSTPDARKARARGYAALIDDAGRGGRWREGLGLLGRELGVEAPSRCAVGVAQEMDRLAVFVRGADGVDSGSHETHRASTVADATSYVPSKLLPSIEGCETVDVLAQPPLQGRVRLPDQFAWSYHAGTRAIEAAPAATARTLVIANVEAPRALDLPQLSPWNTADLDRSATLLDGANATPARVLAAMRRATEIVVHAHALVDLEVSDASFLALAPGADKQYALTARQVRAERFDLHPVVFLAACSAAEPAPYRHEPWSLPAAFMKAGARAVVAAIEPIGDLDARKFVEDVRKRRRAGSPFAVALRDARRAAIDHDPTTSLRSIVLFQ